MNKSPSGNLCQKEPLLYPQVLPGRRQTCHIGGGEGWIKGQLENPLSCRRYGPLQLEIEQELAHGFQDVVGIHHGPLGHGDGVDEALANSEGNRHLLAPGVIDLGLEKGSLGLRKKLF